jgi:hypothetical protein
MQRKGSKLSINADDEEDRSIGVGATHEDALDEEDEDEDEEDDEDKYHGSAAPTKMEAFSTGWVCNEGMCPPLPPYHVPCTQLNMCTMTVNHMYTDLVPGGGT